ncbi:right-handed parallel beta-helix repeat-containing protein [Flavobacterium soyae]|uniref:Right-handed parallel beta-helix repeat-containing protein n=1 Tax=Flavobacterium soyae TaxID=2903098 RepID=A0ABZ2UGW6_9FLAO
MKNIVLIIFFFFASSCNSQNSKFSYKNVNRKLVYKVDVKKEIARKQFINALAYLPKNYLKDGTVDYTECIQKAIDENRNIILPNFPILISEKGLSLKSNSNIYFDSKSKLIIASNSLPKYQILDVRNLENVVIYNPRLVGDKMKHKGVDGEWGMGINILSSKNITIYNPEISNCWGDGIYIGVLSRDPENIVIKGGLLDNNRRNGISIISGKNINVSNIVVSNTNGTLPMAGIDVEPNENKNVLEKINLTNINTFNNGDAGIALILLNMIGKQFHEVDVNINFHRDYFSKYAVIMGGSKTGYKYPEGIKPLGGAIKIKNSQWNDNSDKVSIAADFKYMTKYHFSNLKVRTNGKDDLEETENRKKKIKERGFFVD